MTVRGMIVTLMLLASCMSADRVACPDATSCPGGTVCARYLDISLCVTPEQANACGELADHASCEAGFGFAGTCVGGICLPIGCGNGVIDDPLYRTGEQCDDGEKLGHDGCSSTCRLELPILDIVGFEEAPGLTDHRIVLDTSTSAISMFGGRTYGSQENRIFEHDGDAWIERPRSVLTPRARYGHGVAYDARRQRAVLFGGRAGSGAAWQNDTWEWDGTGWSVLQVALGPAAREGHGMAYDPIRGVTVMYGGVGKDTSLFGDTWEWDGVAWTQIVTEPHPAARSYHSFVFDPGRGVIVMVGQTPLGLVETWEYDGGWRQVVVSPQPPSATYAAMAYDGVARTMVLFCEAAPSLGATWTFDGSGWAQHLPATMPLGVYGPAAVTDPARGGVLLHGGRVGQDNNSNSTQRETWWWDGASWSSATRVVSTGPSARGAPTAARDRDRGRIVVFNSDATTAETLELSSHGWVELAPAIMPSARVGAAMTYDAARQLTVLFGGTSAADGSSTWSWNGLAWMEVAGTPTSPGARSEPAMAFDEVREQVVMFGGHAFGASAGALADTWIWNGSTWTQHDAGAVRPPSRYAHAMAYDPIRQEVVLFGGLDDAGNPLDDTWAWNGTAWRQLHPALSPTSRGNHALAWDAARRRIVVIGGSYLVSSSVRTVDDIWEWDGTAWTIVALRAPPSQERTVAVSALDGAGLVILRSGSVAGTVRRLRWSADTTYEACGAGDHDRDGLQGCDDPDCWAFCTPTCPPGATACVGTGPRCGDGTCNPNLETRQRCPADCACEMCPTICGDFACAPGEDCPGDCP